jgi:hypothetical protein
MKAAGERAVVHEGAAPPKGLSPAGVRRWGTQVLLLSRERRGQHYGNTCLQERLTTFQRVVHQADKLTTQDPA